VGNVKNLTPDTRTLAAEKLPLFELTYLLFERSVSEVENFSTHFVRSKNNRCPRKKAELMVGFRAN